MSVVPFRPTEIFVEREVVSLQVTQKILEKFTHSEVRIIEDRREVKSPTETKKKLLLSRLRADPLKVFEALRCSAGVDYYSLDLLSNCHLECTYCILQSYLENNPILTIYTNIEEIFEQLEGQLQKLNKPLLVGTGRIADSLALESVTGYAARLISFCSKRDDVTLELKTKTDEVGSLLNLPHRGKTIISWSLAPQFIVESEEFKTSSLSERIEAMYQVAQAGYRVGLHFDPVIYYPQWEKEYGSVIDLIFKRISPTSVYWASVGTLRYPMRQKRMMEKKFPKNVEIHEGLQSTNRHFIHYEEERRVGIYEFMEKKLGEYLPAEKVFTCMEDYL